MSEELYKWLQEEFYRSNHPKYRHLFTEWVRNITKFQIAGFSKQMYRKKNNSLWQTRK